MRLPRQSGLAPHVDVPVPRMAPDQGIRPGEIAPLGYHSTYIQAGPAASVVWSERLSPRPCLLPRKGFPSAGVGPLLAEIRTAPAPPCISYLSREESSPGTCNVVPSISSLFSSGIPLARGVILSLLRISHPSIKMCGLTKSPSPSPCQLTQPPGRPAPPICSSLQFLRAG